MQQTDNVDIKKLGRIGFVGAGKAGFTLGKYFVEHGAELSGYYSRTMSSARAAAEFTGCREYGKLEEIVAQSDIVFLTVPDGQIKTVWDEIAACGRDLSGKLICHASGSLSSKVFEGANKRGVAVLSLHPLFAISDKYQSFQQLDKAVFTLEGDTGYRRDAMVRFITACGNRVELIAAEYKPLYHEAAVIASNFLVGLSYLSSSLLEYCGFSPEGAEQALLPLMKGSMDNIIAQGTIDALTGPVERNDCDTVRKHLQAMKQLEGCQKKQDGQGTGFDVECATRIYRDMTRLLMEIASVKHPEEDFGDMGNVIE